jgi:hypothetical protein
MDDYVKKVEDEGITKDVKEEGDQPDKNKKSKCQK